MNKHIGSNFDDFLAAEGTLESSTAVAVKRMMAYQLEKEMESKKISKTEMAKKMHTSRSALDRLLDDNNTAVTLMTFVNAAAALGKKVEINLVNA